MGLDSPNKATRGHVVDKNVDGGVRGCPRDFASPNKGRIDPLGHVQSMGRVCSQWVHVLQGYMRRVPHHH